MNNTELKRHLRRKLERVTMLKLSLEGTVRELASEIISLNEELALVEGGKSSKRKPQHLIYRSIRHNFTLSLRKQGKTAKYKKSPAGKRGI